MADPTYKLVRRMGWSIGFDTDCIWIGIHRISWKDSYSTVTWEICVLPCCAFLIEWRTYRERIDG